MSQGFTRKRPGEETTPPDQFHSFAADPEKSGHTLGRSRLPERVTGGVVSVDQGPLGIAVGGGTVEG
ncbi:hypothetical protein SAMN04487905_105222 [Actinopolyspora xinjiangensis]|uniref:Uncharacterized protein n=1 Tax=Actinopolyspora xinjiangensis TaxID=405564 RepID=A0A1H0TR96_9ACTN|nr:hypothetical protein SAMN04487905_105222 [Actinopolyspora xinjiangensis]